MKTINFVFGISLLLISSCGQQSNFENTQSTDFVGYVNPFIGTSNFGATNPGAIAPRGMVNVSPFNVSGVQNYLEKDISNYTAQRNFDFGPHNRKNISCLSP